MGKYGLLQDCAADVPLDVKVDQLEQRLDAAIDARRSLDFEMVALQEAVRELKATSARMISLIHELTGRF